MDVEGDRDRGNTSGAPSRGGVIMDQSMVDHQSQLIFGACPLAGHHFLEIVNCQMDEKLTGLVAS